MSKNYGDPRKDHLDFFGEELLKEKNENHLSDEQLFDLYKSVEVSVPKVGNVHKVTYKGLSEDDYIFDGGFKDYVRIESKSNESRYLINTEVGEKVDVLIKKIDNKKYQIVGSISEIYESRARHHLSKDKKMFVSAHVKDMTPAGYIVDIFYEGVTLAGFMPNTLAGINKLPNPESILDKRFNVMIESYSRDEGTYIVSRKKYLKTLIPEKIKEVKSGVVYQGSVTGTTNFGVFVEFDECLTGMIHKTNLNPELAEKMHLIQPGMEIEFYIKEIIKNKIILTQILRESIWDTIKVGQVIKGSVKEKKSFGVLVRLDDETCGLVHTSELEKTSKKLSDGDDVKVRVLSTDRLNRKIFLSVVN